MSAETNNSERISLWDCVHDGTLEKFESDLMARTLTMVVDSKYQVEFHKLPEETRIRIAGDGVLVTEALMFEVWPGAASPPREMPWAEAEAQRQRDSENGRLISADWNEFAKDIETDEDYVIMSAEFKTGSPKYILQVDLFSYPNSRYRQVRVQAEEFRFFVGEQQMPLREFMAFGEAFWEARAKRSAANRQLATKP